MRGTSIPTELIYFLDALFLHQCNPLLSNLLQTRAGGILLLYFTTDACKRCIDLCEQHGIWNSEPAAEYPYATCDVEVD